MNPLRFKTNNNCDGCVARVSPTLNNDKHIIKWTVDTVNPEKILTVETDSLSADDVIASLRKTGFKADAIQ